MTKDEALKLALEALEVATTPRARDRQEVLRARAAVQKALAQSEQKPICHLFGTLPVYDRPKTQPEQEPISKVWWDGDKLMAKPIPLESIYKDSEQPSQQEPFAWADLNTLTAQFNSVNCGTTYRLPGEGRQPLYTSPPPCPTCEALARTVMLDQTSHDAQRKPLTDEQIDAGVKAWFENTIVAGRQPFAKRMRAAIEAAHGIKETT